MASGILVLDEDLCIVKYNRSFSEIFPEITRLMKGKQAGPLLPNVPCLSNPVDGYETDIDIFQNGSFRYYHIRVTSVKTRSNQLSGWAILFYNITERKIKEMELQSIEKTLLALNQSKDKFFAIIAHDLRNAFHLITSMAEMQLINLQRNDHEAAMTKAKTIYETSVNAYGLLQNLLNWALVQFNGISCIPAEQELTSLIDNEMTNLMAQIRQKNITISYSMNHPLMVHVDPEMLKVVVRNLVSNAIKYSFPGGNILIQTTEQQETVKVEVIDHGVGMDASEKDNLFSSDSYCSKKGTSAETGSGLGLKLCKEFIIKNQGELWVSSEPGKGSNFSFTLPKSQPQSVRNNDETRC
jgi:signal transduction histidine kinase